jgi:hypothetical protein
LIQITYVLAKGIRGALHSTLLDRIRDGLVVEDRSRQQSQGRSL